MVNNEQPLVLTFDQGTTRSKVALFNLKGKCLGQVASRNQEFSEGDFSYQSATLWWQSLASACAGLLTQHKIELNRIVACSISVARMGSPDALRIERQPQRHGLDATTSDAPTRFTQHNPSAPDRQRQTTGESTALDHFGAIGYDLARYETHQSDTSTEMLRRYPASVDHRSGCAARARLLADKAEPRRKRA